MIPRYILAFEYEYRNVLEFEYKYEYYNFHSISFQAIYFHSNKINIVLNNSWTVLDNSGNGSITKTPQLLVGMPWHIKHYKD